MVKADCHPHKVLDKIPTNRGPIWVTELYAMRAFRSACRRQINAEIRLPHKVRAIKGRDNNLFSC